MKLFVDSGAFIARALEDDKYHAAASSVFAGISEGRQPFRLLFTSNFVVDETATFVLYEAGARVAVSVLDLIRHSPTLRVLHVSEEIEAEADVAFRRYASSGVSYTDCTSQAIMRREGIDTAFSFDRDLEVLGFHRIP